MNFVMYITIFNFGLNTVFDVFPPPCLVVDYLKYTEFEWDDAVLCFNKVSLHNANDVG